MKIAIYVHCFFPNHFYGTEAYALAVAKNLQSRGHTATVVTAVFDGEPPQAEQISRYVWEGVPVISIDKNKVRGRGVRNTYDHPALAPIHEQILHELQPDVVHVCHLINHTASLLDTLRLHSIPTVATLTDFFGFCFTNKLETADGNLCSGPAFDRVNCLECFLKSSAPPQTLARHLLESRTIRRRTAQMLAQFAHWRGQTPSILGFRAADIVDRPDRLLSAMRVYRTAITATECLSRHYRANGLDIPIVTSRFGIDIERRPRSARASGTPIRVGYIGQIAPHKGLHILLGALRGADRGNLSVRIYGDLGQMPAYTRTLMTLSEGLAVTFPGTFPVSRLAEVLYSIDVLVIPATWYENSPLILLQALATHTPVIISDVAGMTEFVTNGVNGLIVERNNISLLATALQQVADSTTLLDRLKQGAEWTRTVNDMVDDVIAVYRGALAVSPQGSVSDTASH